MFCEEKPFISIHCKCLSLQSNSAHKSAQRRICDAWWSNLNASLTFVPNAFNSQVRFLFIIYLRLPLNAMFVCVALNIQVTASCQLKNKKTATEMNRLSRSSKFNCSAFVQTNDSLCVLTKYSLKLRFVNQKQNIVSNRKW